VVSIGCEADVYVCLRSWTGGFLSLSSLILCIPFSSIGSWVDFVLIIIVFVCCCYADVSNALTRLLKCCFSRSATLPSTFYISGEKEGNY
jgi:hypothetical protein